MSRINIPSRTKTTWKCYFIQFNSPTRINLFLIINFISSMYSLVLPERQSPNAISFSNEACPSDRHLVNALIRRGVTRRDNGKEGLPLQYSPTKHQIDSEDGWTPLGTFVIIRLECLGSSFPIP